MSDDNDDKTLADSLRAACDAVGIPHDVEGLIRHHRGNAALAATFDAMRVNGANEKVVQSW